MTREDIVDMLNANPNVYCEHEVPECCGYRTYLGIDPQGHLWFSTQDGRKVHTPFLGPCGPGGQTVEVEVEADKKAFQILMFGHVTRYVFVNN